MKVENDHRSKFSNLSNSLHSSTWSFSTLIYNRSSMNYFIYFTICNMSGILEFNSFDFDMFSGVRPVRMGRNTVETARRHPTSCDRNLYLCNDHHFHWIYVERSNRDNIFTNIGLLGEYYLERGSAILYFKRSIFELATTRQNSFKSGLA